MALTDTYITKKYGTGHTYVPKQTLIIMSEDIYKWK